MTSESLNPSRAHVHVQALIASSDINAMPALHEIEAAADYLGLSQEFVAAVARRLDAKNAPCKPKGYLVYFTMGRLGLLKAGTSDTIIVCREGTSGDCTGLPAAIERFLFGPGNHAGMNKTLIVEMLDKHVDEGKSLAIDVIKNAPWVHIGPNERVNVEHYSGRMLIIDVARLVLLLARPYKPLDVHRIASVNRRMDIECRKDAGPALEAENLLQVFGKTTSRKRYAMARQNNRQSWEIVEHAEAIAREVNVLMPAPIRKGVLEVLRDAQEFLPQGMAAEQICNRIDAVLRRYAMGIGVKEFADPADKTATHGVARLEIRSGRLYVCKVAANDRRVLHNVTITGLEELAQSTPNRKTTVKNEFINNPQRTP